MCVLWLVGVELVPGLHEQLHSILAPHRHDGGTIVTTSFEDTTHRHSDGTIHYVRAKAKRTPRDGRARLATSPGPHEAGLAHHMAALAPAPPPVLVPLPIDRRPLRVAIAIACDLVSIDPLAATARGPPQRA